MKEEEKEEIQLKLLYFWKKTTRKKRQLFLNFMKREGVSQTSMYSYARADFKVEGIVLRGLNKCIDEFESYYQDTQRAI